MTDVPSGQQLKILTIVSLVPNEITALDIMKRDATIGEGTIYAALMRLEEKGFLTSRKEGPTGERGRPRRYYKITGLGVRAQQAGIQVAAIRGEWSLIPGAAR